MTERETKRRAEQSRRDHAQSFTIKEWCSRRKISRAMFYVLDGRGEAPKTHNVGVKRLISEEADAAWVRAREADAQNNAAA